MLYHDNCGRAPSTGRSQAVWPVVSPSTPLGSSRPPAPRAAQGRTGAADPNSDLRATRTVWIDRVIGLGCLLWLAGLSCVVVAPEGSTLHLSADVARALALLALLTAMPARSIAAIRRGDVDGLAWMALPLAPAALGAVLGVLLHDSGVRVDRLTADLPPMFPWFPWFPGLLGEVAGLPHDALVGALVALGVAAPACALAAVFPAASRRSRWLRFLNSPNVRRDLAVTAGVQLSGLVIVGLGCVLAARLGGVTFIPDLVGALVRSEGMRLVVVALALLPLPLLAGYALRLVLPSNPSSGPGASPR